MSEKPIIMRQLSLLSLMLFSAFFISSAVLTGQAYAPATWMNTKGEIAQGEFRLPVNAYSKDSRVYYRYGPKTPMLDPAEILWLAVGNDTLLFRYVDAPNQPLLQLLTGGTFSIYREIALKQDNQYYYRFEGQWQAANNLSLRQDIDELRTKGCLSARNTSSRYQWSDVALIGEDVQDCQGEVAADHYRILGTMEHRQWGLGTNIAGPLGRLVGNEAAVYSLQLGISQQFRRIYRGFYMDAQLMLFHFRDQRAWDIGNTFSFPPVPHTLYDQDWRLTGAIISAGIRLDVSPTRRGSPYFGFGYGVLLPIADQQELTLAEGEPNVGGWPTRVTVSNAVIIGHGSYADIGWAYRPDNRWTFRLHFRFDPQSINTNYSGGSQEAVQLLNQQENFSSISFGSRLELWVQKEIGQ